MLVLAATLLLGCSGDSPKDGLAVPGPVPVVPPSRGPAAKVAPPGGTAPPPVSRVPLVPVSPPVTGLHLRLLRASSGSGVSTVLDGNPVTGWTPVGDPTDESITLRFDAPVLADQLEITACPGAPQSWWTVVVNGAEAGRVDVSPGVPGVLHLGPGQESSRLVSLQLRGADGRRGACLAEVMVEAGGHTLPIRPPRSVAGTLRVSSMRIPYAGHHAWYLIDGRPDFSWTEGKEGAGIGENFAISLTQPIALVGMEVWNGDQRSPEAFAAASRASRVGISVDRGGYVSFPVIDRMGPQRLELPRITVGKLISFAITSVVAGGLYDDLDISEVRLWDPMGPLSVTTPDPDDRRGQLTRETAETGLATVVDRRLQQVCDGLGERRLKLRSNLSFTYFGPGAGEAGLAREVFEGDWAYRQTKAGWSMLELSGRRHPVLMSWVGPEADREDLSVVQTLDLARVHDLGEAVTVSLLGEWGRGARKGAVDCVAANAKAAGLTPFAYLVNREAVVVRGQAFVDLFGPAG